MPSIRFILPLFILAGLTACGSRSDLADTGSVHDAGAHATLDSGVSSTFDAGIAFDASVNTGSWPTRPGTLVATLGQSGDGIAFTSFASPTSPQPAGTISGAWQDSALQSLAFDSLGRVYVVEYQAVPSEPPGRVLVFERGQTTPSRIIGGESLGASYITGLAVDKSFNVYVVRDDDDTPTAGVVVFGPSSDTTPIRWIHGPKAGIFYPTGVAVGDDGKIYLGTDSDPVFVFAADADGDTPPIARIGTSDGLGGTEGVALDKTGRMYITVTYPAPTVAVYFNGVLERTIAGPHTGLDAIDPLAVDGTGRIYVGDYGEGGFRVFAPGASGDVAPEAIVSNVDGFGLAVFP